VEAERLGDAGRTLDDDEAGRASRCPLLRPAAAFPEETRTTLERLMREGLTDSDASEYITNTYLALPPANPIICSPYIEPTDHWIYDRKTGAASRAGSTPIVRLPSGDPAIRRGKARFGMVSATRFQNGVRVGKVTIQDRTWCYGPRL
jgi:hypothetical protein